MLLSKGGRIGYFRGDVKLLVDDIAALQPTIFVGVPRVFDRIYSGIWNMPTLLESRFAAW